MMTDALADIVEQLRRAVTPTIDVLRIAAIADEAATEIVRLREALTAAQAERDDLLASWRRLDETHRMLLAENGSIGAGNGERQRCHAGSDGDCFWAECPQEANNRANYQSYCPLAASDGEQHDD